MKYTQSDWEAEHFIQYEKEMGFDAPDDFDGDDWDEALEEARWEYLIDEEQVRRWNGE